jgi:phosphoglycolate phosphatase-like HAD superfamily hydrolase
VPRGRVRVVLFDFDGTLSLLREGWPAIMTDLMLTELRRVDTGDDLDALVESIVVGLNGWPTVVQMRRLADEIAARGGRPADPAEYARRYQDRLLALIRGRYDDIASGRASAADWAVPGTHALLERLQARGRILVLASGTEVQHVRHEADLLGLTAYFDGRLFAPDGDAPFSKRSVIEHVLRTYGLRGEELLGFGDGVVETEEVLRVGGVAVAVASQEPPARGVNARKRERLIRAGADAVVPDYSGHERLLRWLLAEE